MAEYFTYGKKKSFRQWWYEMFECIDTEVRCQTLLVKLNENNSTFRETGWWPCSVRSCCAIYQDLKQRPDAYTPRTLHGSWLIIFCSGSIVLLYVVHWLYNIRHTDKFWYDNTFQVFLCRRFILPPVNVRWLSLILFMPSIETTSWSFKLSSYFLDNRMLRAGSNG